MGANVKKKSASNIYYAKSAEAEVILHISEVPSGLKCGCVCVACGNPLMARKGQIRRPHFAHVSNYECMYASEVALYKAVAELFEKGKNIALPQVGVRFPAWSTEQQILAAQQRSIDAVEFHCEPLQYPPELYLTISGSKLRILIDFGGYYEEGDLERFRKEAEESGYSTLMYYFPKTDEDIFFAPEKLAAVLSENSSMSKWVFSRLSEQWKQRFLQAAKEPDGHGSSGYLCPIHLGYYKGKYSARWDDCAYCQFNVGTPPGCLCLGESGIETIEDFQKTKEELALKVTQLRKDNEAEIERCRREHAERMQQMSKIREKQVYPGQFVPILRMEPPKPAGPSKEQLDQEYQRIVSTFDPDSPERTIDCFGRRWIRCDICGEIKRDTSMTIYGGPTGPNRGECSACARKKR